MAGRRELPGGFSRSHKNRYGLHGSAFDHPEPCSAGDHHPALAAHRIDDCCFGSRRRADNLYPLIEKRLWIVAFAFGLVHGLGFANVLTDLALPKPALAVSLVSFNLGVEAGAIGDRRDIPAIAYLSRRSWLYPRFVLGVGSLSIAAVASVWLIERSLNVSIFS